MMGVGFFRIFHSRSVLRCVSKTIPAVRRPWKYEPWLQSPYPKSITISSIAPLKRMSSSLSESQAISNEKKENITEYVYKGPYSSVIKKVKLLSLSTCFLSASFGPIIVFMTSSSGNMFVKTVTAVTVILFSATTTGALSWVVNPYVHKLVWEPGSEIFKVDMMSLAGRLITKTVRFSEIRAANTMRPIVTFEANGKFYFVDEQHFSNKDLLAKIIP